ncbi:hypothetical protein AB2M62_18845 [Sphingomonas sp. MMS12-HWE2-04]|uniref:hypothetical protein n=1 Tax=Sphingomonas sp. MMS12-HWE2-04 TaxID=3234199 RepID=UPI00384A5EB7
MASVRLVHWARYLTLLVLVVGFLGVTMNNLSLLDADCSYAVKVRRFAAMLPSLFYLAAIWMIQRAHAAIARGDAVESALATLLERLGACLFLGGIARVFGQLWIIRLALGEPASFAWFDVGAMTLGSLGLLLFILARPLRDAAKARTELAGIV